MKRFSPVLVFMLVLTSLATWSRVAFADGTVTLTKVGPNGYTGYATLTTTLGSDGFYHTEVDITGLTDSTGGLITGQRVAGMYSGTCTRLILPGTPPYQSLNNTFSSGESDTKNLKRYYTQPTPTPTPGPSTYTIAIAGTDGHVAACVDVGMPSVNKPTPVPTRTPAGPSPGMPTTGNPGAGDASFSGLLIMFGGLGLVMLVLGLALRRRAPRGAPSSVHRR
jgi:hypothetical protein